MAFIQMCKQHAIRAAAVGARRFQLAVDAFVADQDRYRAALRLVILHRNIEDLRADNICHLAQDAGKPFGIVLLVDVFDIGDAVLHRFGVADIVHVEAQRFGQVVEPVKLHFFALAAYVHAVPPSVFAVSGPRR